MAISYESAMEKMTPKLLADLIAGSDWSPTTLALDIGRDKDYIRDYLVGRKKTIKADDLAEIISRLPKSPPASAADEPLESEITETAGLRVEGVIQAGTWLEAYARDDMGDDKEMVPVSRDPRFPFARQYVLKVIGDSMDEEAPEGSFVTCVEWGASGLTKKAGMIVHVERVRHDLSETTLKQIELVNGELILAPKSSNKSHKPIALGKTPAEEVFIRGAVLGIFKPKLL